jgi:CPA1 family monovalent cation:H+ antiporter
VIVLTLLQGLVLPAVVRWAHLPADTALQAERQLAITVATEEVLADLPKLAERLGTTPDAVERLRREYENTLRLAQARDSGDEDHPALTFEQDYKALRQAAIAHKRATVIRLRDERRIDDTVLRQLQAQLDLEEVRMNPTPAAE